jgi:hypothetical protein
MRALSAPIKVVGFPPSSPRAALVAFERPLRLWHPVCVTADDEPSNKGSVLPGLL